MAEQSKYTERDEKYEKEFQTGAAVDPGAETAVSEEESSSSNQVVESWWSAFLAGFMMGGRNILRLLTWSRGGANGMLFTLALVAFVLALVFGISPKAPLSSCANGSGIPGNWLSAIEQDCFLRLHQDFGEVQETFHRDDQLWVISEYGAYLSEDDGRSWRQDPFANDLITHVDYGEWGVKAFSARWVYTLPLGAEDWEKQRLEEIPASIPSSQQQLEQRQQTAQQIAEARRALKESAASNRRRSSGVQTASGSGPDSRLKDLFGAGAKGEATTNAPANVSQQAAQVVEPFAANGSGDSEGLVFAEDQFAAGAAESFVDAAQGTDRSLASTGGEDSEVAAISFLSEDIGLAIQSGGRILKTDDGGISWRFAQSADNSASNDILFVDGQYALALGDRGLLRVSRDGGSTWTRRPFDGEHAELDLHKALFVDSQNGWLIGAEGGLWHTRDAGENWVFTRLTSNGEDELVSDLENIYFRNAFEGWVSAANGDLFFTSDGGDNWQLLDAELAQPLRLMASNAGGRLWGISGDAELRVSSNLGDSWQLQMLGATTTSVDFVDVNVGWRVVKGEGVYKSEDGGLSWRLQLVDEKLIWLNFLSSTQGFALADDGQVIGTEDGGENWQPTTSLLIDFLSEIGFRPPLLINPVPFQVAAQSVSQSNNAPAGLNLSASELEEIRAENLTLLDPRSADAYQQRLNYVDEVENLFNGPFDEICKPCTSGYFLQPETAWLGDAQGRIWYTINAGEEWIEQKNKDGLQASQFPIKDILFADAKNGWATTDSTVLRTKDAGVTWIEDSITSPYPQFGPMQGDTPRIIAGNQQVFDWDSNDKRWQPLFKYQLWPSPGSFVFAIISGLALILLILRIRSADIERSKSVLASGVKSIVRGSVALAGKSESDAPIDSLDKDCLGTGSLAVSLFKFIHNKNTSTPLNIAITGAWGKGKSSVMGMLANLLQQHQYRTIWFNAWHYRSEETFLGAFLQTIEMEALPPWYTLRGLLLRYKLGISRMSKLLTVVSLIAVLAAAGLLHTAASEHVECQTQHIQWTLCQQRIETLSQQLWAEMVTPPEDTLMAGTMSLMAGSGVLGLLWALVKSFSIFGWLRGSKELAFWKDQFSLTEFKADPGMRYRIEKVLEDLSGVLGKRPLIIFFDDVDRCPPERQLQVMETINFLSSHNRNGVYLIGAALDIVVPSLATAFNTIVKEKIEPKKEGESSDAYDRRLARARQDYARDYMRKMVTLEVSVPSRIEPSIIVEESGVNIDEAEENRTGDLDSSSENIEEKTKSDSRSAKYSRAGTEVSGLNRFLQVADRVVLPLMICLITLTAAFWFWDSAGTVAGKSSRVIAATSLPSGSAGAEGGGVAAFPPPTGSVSAHENSWSAPQNGGVANFSSDSESASAGGLNPFASVDMMGISPDFNYSVFIPLSIGIVFLFAFLITRQDKIQADDSEEFISAEKIWRRVLQFHNQTEREYKRTLNLLRLLVARMETRSSSSTETAHSFVVLMALYLGVRGFYKHESAEVINNKMDGFLKTSRNRELYDDEKQQLRELLLQVIKENDPLASQSIERFIECWVEATESDQGFNDTILPTADSYKREFFRFMSEVVLH